MTLTVYIDSELLEQVDAVAMNECRTRSGVASMAVRRFAYKNMPLPPVKGTFKGSIQVGIRLHEDEERFVREIAEKNKSSISNVIKTCLKLYVKDSI